METKKGIYPCVKCAYSTFKKKIAPKLKKYGFKIVNICLWDEYPYLCTNECNENYVANNSDLGLNVHDRYLCKSVPEFLAAVKALAIERGWFKGGKETTTEQAEEKKWAANCDIKELPTRLRRMAEYRKKHTSHNIGRSQECNTVDAFVWDETPEGGDFWGRVAGGCISEDFDFLGAVLDEFECKHPELLEEMMSATSAFLPEVEMKRNRIDNRYMAMAYIWAENSYCERRKVGALIVKDKMIISDGYNGTPSGFPNVCENEEGSTFSYVLHAEANAITKVAKSTNNCEGATLYVTTSPCIECSKLIIQAGIKRVVYCEEYRNTEGIDLLKQAGIKVDQIDKKEIICQVGSIFKK